MKSHRILLVDDTPAIHQDFRKILSPTRALPDGLEADEQLLFGGGGAPGAANGRAYEFESAMQGREGVDMVIRAVRAKRPYALVFVDMRMPPGWDGVVTAEHILGVAPSVELCVCSAYSDYSWHDVIRRIRRPGLRHVRKPFDTREILQVAAELTDKWDRANGGAD